MHHRNCEFLFSPLLPSSLIRKRRGYYGRLFAYDKIYDRITPKTERPLQPLDRMKYNPTTSDDPVIQQVRLYFKLSFKLTHYPLSSLPKVSPLSMPPT